MFKSVDMIRKEEFQGTSPTVFVGQYGYPKVNVGIISSSEQNSDASLFDAPHYWAINSFTIKKVVELRSSLINSRFKSDVGSSSKNLGYAQDIAMSSKPVDVDIKLFEKPKLKISFSNITLPMGPSAFLKGVNLASNPKAPNKVEKVVSDTDLKSVQAMSSLHSAGFNENDISKILSVGVLGVKRSRRLVPTRWSITATDDTLAKLLIKRIKSYSTADYQLYHGSLYGNYYFVMFFPEVWGYELFEGYLPMSLWNKSNEIGFVADYELYTGRKGYAESTAGGYYAARLPIVEKLDSLRRQASVLVLRFITDEYSCPLGVFVCREAVRRALSSRPTNFSSKMELLNHAKKLVKSLFNYDIDSVLGQSVLLKGMKNQTKLSFFSESPEPNTY